MAPVEYAQAVGAPIKDTPAGVISATMGVAQRIARFGGGRCVGLNRSKVVDNWLDELYMRIGPERREV